MSLFNFFTKRNQKRDIWDDVLDDKTLKAPIIREVYRIWFQNAVKQAINLREVGRENESDVEVSLFIKNFTNRARGGFFNEQELIKINFYLTFKFLPDLIINDWDEFMYYWKSPAPFTFYLAMEAFLSHGKKLTFQQQRDYNSIDGPAMDNHNYYLICFPNPDLFASAQIRPPFSATRFMVVFHNDDTQKLTMYSLQKTHTNENVLRIIIDSKTSGAIGFLGQDASVQTFLFKSLDHYNNVVCKM
jgi:hypothetical protein